MAGGGAVVVPAASMVLFQLLSAGVNIFYKLAVADGMDLRVLIAYRYIFAAIFLAPVAYFVERDHVTRVLLIFVFRRVLGLSFVSGLAGGSVAQNLYIAGIKCTSATFASATTNLVPAMTFVLAVAFRYEQVGICSLPGQAKVAGTLLGVAGAMLLTFYKGVDITPWHSQVNLVATLTQHRHGDAAATTNYALGAVLCVSSCFFYALWLVVQAKLSSSEYPFHYSSTALMCAMTALQSAAFALCFDRDAAQWRLKLNIRLLSCAYTGVFASVVALVVLSWCVKKRGPLFASVFSPLMLLMVAVLSSLLLIILGLYAVLWARGRRRPPRCPRSVAASTPPPAAPTTPPSDLISSSHGQASQRLRLISSH